MNWSEDVTACEFNNLKCDKLYIEWTNMQNGTTVQSGQYAYINNCSVGQIIPAPASANKPFNGYNIIDVIKDKVLICRTPGAILSDNYSLGNFMASYNLVPIGKTYIDEIKLMNTQQYKAISGNTKIYGRAV